MRRTGCDLPLDDPTIPCWRDSPAMHVRNIPNDKRSLHVVTWPDPVVDQVGYDPHPVRRALLAGHPRPVRHVAPAAPRQPPRRLPAGYDLDLARARSLGLGSRPGATAAFPRTVARCCQFGTARFHGPHTLAVRRMLPRSAGGRSPASRRLQDDHAQWIDQSPTAVAEAMRERPASSPSRSWSWGRTAWAPNASCTAGGSTRRWPARPPPGRSAVTQCAPARQDRPYERRRVRCRRPPAWPPAPVLSQSTTWPDSDHADRHELHGAWRWWGW